MYTTKQITHSERFSFFIGGGIGILLFLFLYGFSTLDVTNVEWLLGKYDLTQHYLGWCFYRNSDWLFPIGLANTLSYPLTSSVIYTDSIPFFAVFFKIIRGILPETFQYIGWFQFLAYFLQGGISALLVHRLTGNAIYGALSSLFFLLFPAFFVRISVFNHTALSAHFLILLSLLVLLTHRGIEHIGRGILIWGAILCLSVGIHFYFMPMVGCCLLFYAIKVKLTTHRWRPAILTLATPLLAAFIMVWLLGGLSSNVTSANHSSIGTLWFIQNASANLNTFINSQGLIHPSPLIHPTMKVNTVMALEGFCYLGAGILMGLILIVFLYLINKNIHAPIKKLSLLLKRYNVIITLSIFSIFFLIAILPTVCWNDKILFSIPLWQPIEKIWLIFRATGRFIWMPAYILLLILTIGVWRCCKKRELSYCILSLLLVLQIVDVQPWMKAEGIQKSNSSYNKMENFCKLNTLLDGKKHIAFSRHSGNHLMDEFVDIFHAATCNNVSSNAFYYARYFDGYIEYVERQADSLMRHPSEDYLYVLVDGMPADTSSLYSMLDIEQIGPYTVAVKKEVAPKLNDTTSQNE